MKGPGFNGTQKGFQGRIWVDDKDLQIVRTSGQAIATQPNQLFPRFESYREDIDGKYWFPTYVYADDTLNFRTGSVHVKMTVRFTNYRRIG
ncbi:MAG: hypothetical protein ACREDR_04370 [Blastocatellia bacterium]